MRFRRGNISKVGVLRLVAALVVVILLPVGGIGAQENDAGSGANGGTSAIGETSGQDNGLDSGPASGPDSGLANSPNGRTSPVGGAAAPGPALILRTGLFLQGQAEDTSINGVEASPIVHNYGAAVSLPLGPGLAFEPGLDLFYDEYVYIASIGRAVPTQMETGSAVGPLAGVLGVSVDLPFNFRVSVSETFHFDFLAGLTAWFRLPVAPLDGTTADELGMLGDSMNGLLKWLLPQAGAGFGVALDQTTELVFSIRLHVPLWHLWDERGLDFWDSNLVWTRLGIKIGL